MKTDNEKEKRINGTMFDRLTITLTSWPTVTPQARVQTSMKLLEVHFDGDQPCLKLSEGNLVISETTQVCCFSETDKLIAMLFIYLFFSSTSHSRSKGWIKQRQLEDWKNHINLDFFVQPGKNLKANTFCFSLSHQVLLGCTKKLRQ